MFKASVLSAFVIIIICFISITGCKDNSSPNSTTGGGNSNQPGTNEIWMQNVAFVPTSLTISKGTTIKWINKDSFDHTASSGNPSTPNSLFDSGNMGQNKTFSFKFDSAGTFHFYCKVHPQMMQGVITVQ
jgi:plastocyanin